MIYSRRHNNQPKKEPNPSRVVLRRLDTLHGLRLLSSVYTRKGPFFLQVEKREEKEEVRTGHPAAEKCFSRSFKTFIYLLQIDVMETVALLYIKSREVIVIVCDIIDTGGWYI